MPGLAVDAELRWAMLRRLAVTGRAGDAEIGAELRRDPTDAGTRHATACHAAVPDAAHKAAAWQLLAETGELGALGVVECSRGFIQPSTPTCSPRTPSVTSTRCRRSGRPAASTFAWCSAGCCSRIRRPSPELLGRIDAFLAAPRDPGLARVLTETRDIVARALRSRALPAALPA